MAAAVAVHHRPVVLLGLIAGLAVLLLDFRPLVVPGLMVDDFQILSQSWTWERTWAGLWLPQNEHAMPLGRLFTFGLDGVAGRPTALPRAASLVGPLALLLGLPLLYAFVRRETDSPAVALAALILFGVSSVYNQAIYWFAASFAVLSVDTLLLALLACQRWRQTGRPLALAAAVVLVALCPGWFALGILAGPLCALFLLASRPQAGTAFFRPARLVSACAPLLGTILFLAVSLPRTLDHLNHLPHHEGQKMLEVLDPLLALAYTGRAVVDGLVLGTLGVTGVMLPVAAVVVIWPVLAAVGFMWWRQARAPALLWLGLGMIGSGYLLVYIARTRWGYEIMTQPNFNRYHLLPHLGLVLFVCGGLPGRWCFRDEVESPSRLQVRVLAVLLAVCLLFNWPRGLLCAHAGIPSATLLEHWKESAVGRFLLVSLSWDQVRSQDSVTHQMEALRCIEEVDALCRRHHISGDDARAALPPLDIQDSAGSINGWDFLEGSPSPQQRPREEIRRLLRPAVPADLFR